MDSDQKLKIFGELLASNTSRRIIEILSDHTLYLVEITNALNIRTSLTVYHIKKLVQLEMVTITNKVITKNPFKEVIDHKHYTMKPEFHIVELRKIIHTEKL